VRFRDSVETKHTFFGNGQQFASLSVIDKVHSLTYWRTNGSPPRKLHDNIGIPPPRQWNLPKKWAGNESSSWGRLHRHFLYILFSEFLNHHGPGPAFIGDVGPKDRETMRNTSVERRELVSFRATNSSDSLDAFLPLTTSRSVPTECLLRRSVNRVQSKSGIHASQWPPWSCFCKKYLRFAVIVGGRVGEY
jgi:hypothetical protein